MSEEFLFEEIFGEIQDDYFAFDVDGSSQKYYVLVIYDIIDNKRRTKFAKLLEGYGKRVQKSAFEAFLSSKKADKLIREIPKFCQEEDSIRLYKIIGKGQVTSWGQQAPGEDENVIVM